MKLVTTVLCSALAITSYASSVWASPTAPAAPAAAPHFSAPAPATRADMKQIQAAALRSFSHSPLSHGLATVPKGMSVTIVPSQHPAGFIGSGFPKVSAVFSSGPGMYNPRQLQPQASAQFYAVRTWDPKTGQEAWKLNPIKDGGRVWNRLYTMAAPH